MNNKVINTYEIIRQFSGTRANISIPRVYIKFCEGNYNHASVLSQLVFWSDKGKAKDGWFYRPYKSLAEELCLTVEQVRYAVNGLKKKLGAEILVTKRKKVFQRVDDGDPIGVPIVHFKIDSEKLLALLFPDLRMSSLNSTNGIGDFNETKENNSLSDSVNLTNGFGEFNGQVCEDSQTQGFGKINERKDSGNFTNLVLTDPKTDPKTDLIKDLAPSNELHEAVQRIPVYKIPLNKKNEFHEIYSEDIQSAQELYPAVDVNQEIRKMIGWSESNPRKRKTSRGIKAFINTWLSREQDKGPRKPIVQDHVRDEDEIRTLQRRIGVLESEMDSENIMLRRNMELGGIQAAIDSSNGRLKKMAQERQELLEQIDMLQGAA